MPEDADLSAEADVLLRLLRSYLQGLMSVDEFVIAIHQFPPLQSDHATIGFNMDLAGEDEKRRMQELIDAFSDPPSSAV